MKRAAAMACGVLIWSCRGAPSLDPAGAASEPQVVADWNGGRATLAEVEGALLSLSPAERLAREADIVNTYREVARERALAQILLPRPPGDAPVALEGSAGVAYGQILAQLYSRDVALRGRDVGVGDADVKAYYDAHPEEFRQKAQVFLYNIYRRRRGSEDPAAALAFLAGIKKRAQAGEPFTALARAHSDSDTRANDGRVGWVERGVMAPPLDRVAFSLKQGQVSDPVAVPNGAVLLYASKVVPEKTLDYKDVRGQIQRSLERSKVQEALEAWAREVPLPPGSLVLSQPELRKALASGADDQPALRIGQATLTLGELKKSLPAPWRARGDEAQAYELYRQRVRAELLIEEARRSGYAEKPETRAELNRSLRRALERNAVNERLEARLKGDLAPQDAVLRAYYEEYPQRFMRRPYEQARSDVLQAYLNDKRKELLDGAAERVLADAHFHFFEDRVRAALAVTAPRATGPTAK
jgi:parvulin-like peptidyl-prolyl cis-trans isomerase-like protein